jgi:hypothetical protein
MRMVLVAVIALAFGACGREAPTPGESSAEAPTPGEASGGAPAPGKASGGAPAPGEASGEAPGPGEASGRGALVQARQHLLVVTEAPGAMSGTLFRMERVDSAEGESETQGPGLEEASWRQAGPPTPVVVGRSGVGPKREGDGRSPQGIFGLGPVFGYAPQPPSGVTLPYEPITTGSVCVDDPASAHYNQVLNADTLSGAADWTSHEDMRRDLANGDNLYKWGLIVRYNTPPEPGAGSCIFLHVWRASDRPPPGAPP